MAFIWSCDGDRDAAQDCRMFNRRSEAISVMWLVFHNVETVGELMQF